MKRIIAVLLVIALAVSICPAVFAEGGVARDREGNVLSEDALEKFSLLLHDGEYIDEHGCVIKDGMEVGVAHWKEEWDTGSIERHNQPMEHTVLDIPPRQQEANQTCWASAIAMIATFRLGYTVYDADIVYAAYEIEEGSANLPGSWELVKKGCNAYGLSVTRTYSSMNFDQVKAQIDRGDPLVLVGQTPRGNYHDVVIVGYGQNRGGTYIYHYNEPWTGERVEAYSTYAPVGFYMNGEYVTWVDTYWGFYVM